MYNSSCENTYSYLDSLHIPYRILKDSTNDGISGMKTCEAIGFSPSEVYKTIMLRSKRKKHPYIAVLPADRKLDPDKFSLIVGTPCYKAGRDYVSSVCSTDIGLFSPFFPKNIIVCLDISAQKRKTIVVNAGGAGNYIELAVSDFVSAVECRFGDLSSGSSVELYGRNYALPAGSAIDKFQIGTVKKITPLEIFYEATDRISGHAVDICEFFPRFHGCYAVRGNNGEDVEYLEYTNDMCPLYKPSYGLCGMVKNRHCIRNIRIVHDFAVNCPEVILQISQNGTFYTIYERPCGKTLADLIMDTDPPNWVEIKNTLLPLLEQIEQTQLEKNVLGCIRPDTVYLDRQNRRACLLTFCASTDLFGHSSMRYMYRSDYDPFMVDDITAFYRILCFTIVGKQWYISSSITDIIKNKLPIDDAEFILKGAKFK